MSRVTIELRDGADGQIFVAAIFHEIEGKDPCRAVTPAESLAVQTVAIAEFMNGGKQVKVMETPLPGRPHVATSAGERDPLPFKVGLN